MSEGPLVAVTHTGPFPAFYFSNKLATIVRVETPKEILGTSCDVLEIPVRLRTYTIRERNIHNRIIS